MSVAVEGLVKTFSTGRASRRREIVALDELALSAEDGELLAVVGPSGSGKTTLLRAVAGLETPDAGTIDVGHRDVTHEPPWDRDVAMVFQEYALYPHLSAAANITYGLRARKVPREQIDSKLKEVSDELDLAEVLDRRPHELSGGEKQRVALARAMVREPKAFLMDEPLSSLDAELRVRTRAEIKALQRRIGITTVYVTHDQFEAMTIGDRVAVLRNGRVEQVDNPLAIYERPANAFVARFIGNPPMNLLPSSLLPENMRTAPVAGIRPERIALVHEGEGVLDATVELIEVAGAEAIVHLDVAGHAVLAKAEPRAAPVPRATVGLSFDPAEVRYFASIDGPAAP